MNEQQRGANVISLRRGQLSRKHRSFRPLLEQLEARELLASNLTSPVLPAATRSHAASPAPAFTNSSFLVPGAANQTTTVQFTWNNGVPTVGDEIGVYVVQDAKGTVNGVAPTSSNYASTVLKDSSHQIIFDKGTGIGTTRTLNFTGGTRLGLYLLQNRTSPPLLFYNPGQFSHPPPH